MYKQFYELLYRKERHGDCGNALSPFMLTEHKKYQSLSITTTSPLIAGLINHDRSAFETVYDKYAPCLYTYIFRIIGDRTASEKVLEKTFEKLLSDISSFNERRDDLFIWLLNISRTEAIEALINNYSRRAAISSQVFCVGTPAAHLFIGLLNPIEKTIFALMYYRNFNCDEIAELLKVRVGLIKAKVQTAYQKLQYEYPNQNAPKQTAPKNLVA